MNRTKKGSQGRLKLGPETQKWTRIGSFKPKKTPEITGRGVGNRNRRLLLRKRRQGQRGRRWRHRERRSGVNLASGPEIHDPDLLLNHIRVRSEPLGTNDDQIVTFLLQSPGFQLRIERLPPPENGDLLHLQPRKPRIIEAGPFLHNPFSLFGSGNRLPRAPEVIVVVCPRGSSPGKPRRWNSDAVGETILWP